MKKHPLYASALVLLLFIYACGPRNTGTTDTTNDTIPEIVDTVAIVATEVECDSLLPGQFCSRGLDIVKLGESLAWNSKIIPSFEDAEMKDTVFTEISKIGKTSDTVSWYVKMLQLPDGMVALEADFNDVHLLGRIRIESARYHHISGLRVGSSGKELKATLKDAYVIPFIEHGVMEVIVPYQTGKMIFHIPQEGIYKSAKRDYSLADVPDDARVIRIVLM